MGIPERNENGYKNLTDLSKGIKFTIGRSSKSFNYVEFDYLMKYYRQGVDKNDYSNHIPYYRESGEFGGTIAVSKVLEDENVKNIISKIEDIFI